jgi:DNA-binding XRE family transcriptional regulator
MYNYNKLKGLIKQYFNTQERYAQYLGIGKTTLTSRLNGDTYFTQQEIEKSIKAFNLTTTEDIELTFFAKN